MKALLLLLIPLLASCQKEDDLYIKDIEAVVNVQQAYPQAVIFQVSMPDGSTRGFNSGKPDETKDLLSGILPNCNEVIGKVLYYNGESIKLTVTYDYATKSVIRVTGRIDDHTFAMNMIANTINICNGPQNVPASITLH